jgi:hypothetical protein
VIGLWAFVMFLVNFCVMYEGWLVVGLCVTCRETIHDDENSLVALQSSFYVTIVW